FRTGAKTVVLDRQGKLLHDTVIHPTTGAKAREEAAAVVRDLVENYSVEAIAIGNGTASRETEAFVRSLGLPASVVVVVVNESGASVYSASDIARQEFPDKDVTVRGAVSIGRRLMDPLAELVKIDPKAIGVGQYQHDVQEKALRAALDDMVMYCVNAVGVEVNTASAPLLSYVSGLGPALAKNIVAYRDENGPFASRAALKKVPRLGPKAFQQSAGFLRVRDGKNPLDASAVHPERYQLVATMAADLGCTVEDLIRDETLRRRIDPNRYVGPDVGLPTITDIQAELAKPGRDPRAAFEVFSFADGVNELADVKPGMVLPGIVTNVTNFGAFIDVGVHQDGLAHISQLADTFVKNPADVIRVGERVKARVLEVDLDRRRISLSLKTR
ncbi:MAG: helix-hairpin-helix domain-containing protein, partial [Planctomycetes bacterium]|nr:helix-hairpin-helix domain-containing protein [Planctomycetota bacterium]